MKTLLSTAVFGLGLAGHSAAQTPVNADIIVDTTWDLAGSPYDLTKQIYVTNGATLTIDPGVVVASTPTINGSGSLAVTRGSQIFVNGTANNPVIMTSTNDDFATWREAANEWGNLAIMGEAYISEDDPALGNSPVPSATNEADMEGLNNGPSTDRYGGGNDDDDSGTINYLSIRYGGRVVGLGNELNGLSLGGIGRGTDIDYVEIMNNVDDGIEIWGGTVNLKHFSIWNIGDDSFDVDQGWRGKAQFGLIVQGHSIDNSQGSGVGDNCFETDGAENSDWQPRTRAAIYNCTVIGQPAAGDHGTAWRDGAGVQYGNSIWMDLGEQLVKFDNIDGDGGLGYGHNGTLGWPAIWNTDASVLPAVNAPLVPGPFYQAQSTTAGPGGVGKVCQIIDSVFFRNLNPSAYTEASTVGTLGVAYNNDQVGGSIADADAPVQCLVRGNAVIKGTKLMLPVLGLDPRPRNEALNNVGTAPADAFLEAAGYRGAFAPKPTPSWLNGWTASWQYGFTPDDTGTPAANYCTAGTSASGCQASLSVSGHASASAGSGFNVTATDVEGNKQGLFFFGTNGRQANSWGNGTSFQCVVPPVKRGGVLAGVGTNGQCDGSYSQDLNALWAASPAKNPGAGAYVQLQLWYRDPANTSNQTTSLSDAIEFCVAQ